MRPGAALMLALAACGRPPAAEDRQTQTVAVVNGKWFDGGGFVGRTFYIRSGLLERDRPSRVDSVLDLQGRFVIPPLGDAHTHNLDGGFGLAEIRSAYRAEGTFYVQVLTNTATGAAQVRSEFDGRCSLDVVYANGGLTSTLSHPFLAYEPRAMGVFEDFEAHAEEIRGSRIRENDAYWFIDSEEDLSRKWPLIQAADPGIIKVFLLDATEAPPDVTGAGLPHGRGLRPSLLSGIVERAGRAGLRVAAHVETAADFGAAVHAGVGLVAHMPGYLYGASAEGSLDPTASAARFEISEELAGEAGERGVFVTPTVAWTHLASGPDSATVVARRQALMRRNVKTLRDHGVRLVGGSDWFGETAWHEIEAMRALGAWTELELLRMWAVQTPRAIFPDRRIGRLEAGYEASFLVLRDDPSQSLDALRSIELRVKQGCLLDG